MEKRNTGNGFNLFLFGVLIGVLATLLLTTKKGRKILKVIMDEGIERFSRIEDVFGRVEEEMVEDEMVEPDPMADMVNEVSPEAVKTAIEAPVPVKRVEKIEIDEPKKSRRLFKGIRRKTT